MVLSVENIVYLRTMLFIHKMSLVKCIDAIILSEEVKYRCMELGMQQTSLEKGHWEN